jgi:hypothetical protein
MMKPPPSLTYFAIACCGRRWPGGRGGRRGRRGRRGAGPRRWRGRPRGRGRRPAGGRCAGRGAEGAGLVGVAEVEDAGAAADLADDAGAVVGGAAVLFGREGAGVEAGGEDDGAGGAGAGGELDLLRAAAQDDLEAGGERVGGPSLSRRRVRVAGALAQRSMTTSKVWPTRSSAGRWTASTSTSPRARGREAAGVQGEAAGLQLAGGGGEVGPLGDAAGAVGEEDDAALGVGVEQGLGEAEGAGVIAGEAATWLSGQVDGWDRRRRRAGGRGRRWRS